jgi:CHAT domain-containing protein
MSPNSQVLTGEDATKENFLRSIGDAGVFHFAGHYLPDPDVPSHSKLILARAGGGADLQMSEISGKKLPNLRLVVLSACETGIGNVFEGEGLISASRAFLAAGVPVVVASQWKVDSDATEKLMVAFHRNHLQKGMNSAAALRQAQIEMIEAPAGSFASPYFWAAFSVIGGLES